MTDPSLILQIVVAGLAQGSLYALAALGLVVIYNASSVVNFAQGAMGMAATYFAWVLLNHYNVPYPLAFLGALVVAFAFGALVQAVLLRRLLGASIMTQVVVTLGLLMALQGLLGLAFGVCAHRFPQGKPGA